MTHSNVIRGRLIESGERVSITMEAGNITEVAPDRDGSEGEAPLWIAAGLVDLQINGYGGYDLNAEGASLEERVETVRAMTRAVLRTGTTSFCPTVITASEEQIRIAMEAIGAACERDELVSQCVAGIHLEGPYISREDGPRGAHPLQHARNPLWEEFQGWNEASGGRIRIVTLAPELDGAIEMIRRLAAAGIRVALGHTAASEADIAAAAEAGATLSTHLGNGAHPQLPRHPNYIWGQLAEDRLIPSLIADGHHLPPSFVKVASRVKPQLVLVSDAVHLAGMEPGVYKTHIGGQVELLPSGRLQTAANPLILAGAASSLATCAGNFSLFSGRSLAESLRAASAVPAGILGAAGIGSVREGYAADLILFAMDGYKPDIQTVIKGGQVVYDAQSLVE